MQQRLWTKNTIIQILVLIIEVNSQASSNTLITLSQFSFTTNNVLSAYFNNCRQAEVEIVVQTYVTSVSYMSSAPLENEYTSSELDGSDFSAVVNYSVPNPAHQYTISSRIDVSCRGNTVSDYAVLYAQNENSWNWTTNAAISGNTTSFNWTLSSLFNRQCLRTDQFGFNCNTTCTPVNDGVFCYTCSADGNRVCCDLNEVSQSYCNYRNVTLISTTGAPNTGNYTGPVTIVDKGHQTLFMWLMIGAGALCLFFFIMLIIVLVICCNNSSKPSEQRREEYRPESRAESRREYRRREEPRSQRNYRERDISEEREHRIEPPSYHSYSRRATNMSQPPPPTPSPPHHSAPPPPPERPNTPPHHEAPPVPLTPPPARPPSRPAPAPPPRSPPPKPTILPPTSIYDNPPGDETNHTRRNSILV